MSEDFSDQDWSSTGSLAHGHGLSLFTNLLTPAFHRQSLCFTPERQRHRFLLVDPPDRKWSLGTLNEKHCIQAR
ncbi:hypothetical protein AAFF_G00396730 [Aldrovandia affinis]|uniref:Uncharacterized protein n=1 Tax=Aldrovandia affinis TaxID=143900 RepID=A0AAD7R601_9TELE|nr:hypothetical protein AAFF_G00396730 [Aldrovandia affinis]